MLSDHYNVSADVLRCTVTAGLDPTKVWVVSTTINALLVQSSANRVIKDEGGRILSDHELYCDYMSMTEQDMIQIGTTQYLIYRVDNPNGLHHHLEVYLKRVQLGNEVDIDS